MDAMLTKKADALAKEFAGQATTLEELNDAMRTLMKTALESMLNTELDVHLGRTSEADNNEIAAAETAGLPDSPTDGSAKPRNRRNGTSPKTIQGDMGKLPLAVPRDRDGTFAPLLLGKYQRRLPGFDEKILALYAKGMTTRDIQEIVKELYGVEISPTLVSEITEDLDGEVRAWQTRRLESVWPIVFLDGIVVHTDADSREVIRDLRNIYQAATVLEAEEELKKFSERWEAKYPTIVKQWTAKWPHIISMFDLPAAIRKATYTTNMIESVNSVIRKFTRNRKQYPNRESALKLISMAIHEAWKKWTMPIPKWKEALNHFAILFENRMPKTLN